jgi:hypothetical protein
MKEKERKEEEEKTYIDIYVYLFVIFYFRSDLIGCMSFNMKTLLKTTSCTKVRKSIKSKCEKERERSEIFI